MVSGEYETQISTEQSDDQPHLYQGRTAIPTEACGLLPTQKRFLWL